MHAIERDDRNCKDDRSDPAATARQSLAGRAALVTGVLSDGEFSRSNNVLQRVGELVAARQVRVIVAAAGEMA